MGDFWSNTRLVTTHPPAQNKPAGGGTVQWQLPKVGFLAAIALRISATVSGTLSNHNPLGLASIIRQVSLTTNSAIDILRLSGAGYSYLLDEVQRHELFRATPQNQGRSAVAAGTFNLDMWLPVALNLQSTHGLILLQNEQLTATLSVDFLTDSQVATGATVNATVTPTLYYYLVPRSPDHFPPLNILHTITEETQAVTAAGDVTYILPRGYTYLQVLHGLGIGASGADGFNRFQVRVGQSQFPYDWTLSDMDMQHYYLRGRARPAGGIYLDYIGLSGAGDYGMPRDILNTAVVTDLAHVITATGPGTLYTIRRQLVPLAA